MSRRNRKRKRKMERRPSHASGAGQVSRARQPPLNDPVLRSIVELGAGLDIAWEKGWHPQDMIQMLHKDAVLDRAVFVDALSLNRVQWHPHAGRLWTEQADSLGAISPWWNRDRPYWPQFRARHGAGMAHDSDQTSQRLASAVSFLTMICEMGATQPMFEALPTQPAWHPQSSGGAGGSGGVLAKVRALLSKAESTEYEHEAEALSAKAQELIARHSIDVALLADEHDVPGGRKVYLSDPYAKAKFMLLSGIAGANNCRCVWRQRSKTATLIGHQSDLHLVEVLFTSLLLQGTGAVLASGAKTNWQGKSTTRSWRNAFWYGLAGRIEERLAEATTTAQDDHQHASGQDFLPVLVRRSDAVDQALKEAFPSLGTVRTSVSNIDGLDAGNRFANRAELDSDRHLNRRERGQLSSAPDHQEC